ncbi:hypothetical protein EIP86_009984, partial [Pleurotus ostreatoroseus]
MNNEEVDAMLRVIEKIQKGAPFTFRTHNDVRNAWDTASKWYSSFQETVVTESYGGKEYSFPLLFRDPVQWGLDLAADPNFARHMKWDARKMSKWDSRSQTFKRFIHEPWTADLWDEIQSQLPKGGSALTLIVYADKTKLSSSTGGEKGYPVMGKFANFGADLYNGRGPAGAQVLGWLPVIVDDEMDKGKKKYVNMKQQVWHTSMRKILERVISLGKTGIMWRCGDGVERWIFPVVLLLTGDFEEQSVMLLTRGTKGLCPCPICLVPAEKQDSIGKFWPLRKPKKIKAIVEDQSLRATAKDALLKEMGARDVYNVFWDVPHMNPHLSICFDRLHFNAGGEFGGHLWKELQFAVEDTKRHVRSAIDHQYDIFPRWRNLNHFGKVLHTEFSDGSKYEDIAK